MLALLALVGWRLLLPALRAESFAVVVDDTGGAWSQDFAPILTLARGFWHGTAGYDVESFRRVTEERVGRPVQHALPFPYLPTMLWVLGPFCLLPTAWAYVVWTLLGIGAVWWMTRARWALWLLVAFFTPAAFWCLRIGQTSILSTAALFFLMLRDLDRRRPRADWPDALVLWALAAKPPLALTAGLALLVRGRPRPVVVAALATVVTTAVLTPLLGVDWMWRYVVLMGHYDLETADPVYAVSIVPELMGNLRALLHVTLHMGDAAASRWSAVAWLMTLGALAASARRRELGGEAVWSVAVLAYLLFCPHVTGTEDLKLVLPLALLTDPARNVAPLVRWASIGAVLIALSVPPVLGRHDPLRVPLAVASKVVVAMLVAMQWVAPRRLAVTSFGVDRESARVAGTG